MDNLPFKVGSKIKVEGYPRPTDPYNGFDFNGLVGEVQSYVKIGRGLNDRVIYAYDIFFPDVNVPFVNHDSTGRLVRGVKVQNAMGWQMDESYLSKVE